MLTMAIPDVEFGGSLVHIYNMFLIYLPDGTNVCNSRGGEFDGAVLV